MKLQGTKEMNMVLFSYPCLFPSLNIAVVDMSINISTLFLWLFIQHESGDAHHDDDNDDK